VKGIGGLPERRPDQQFSPPPAAVTPGAAAGIVRAHQVIVWGPGQRVLVYSGSPAAGNLIGSWAGAAGTDPYGNAYPQGLNVTVGAISGTVFSGTDFIINANGFFWYTSTPVSGISNNTFETGIAGWTAYNGAVLTQSATQKHSGAFSGKITPDGVTTYPGINTATIPCAPGTYAQMSCWLWSAISQVCGVFVNFYNAGNVQIGQSAIFPAVAAGWQQVILPPAAAPPLTVSANFNVELENVTAPLATSVVYVDDIYGGTGALIGADALAAAGTDNFGNVYDVGDNLYAAGTTARMGFTWQGAPGTQPILTMFPDSGWPYVNNAPFITVTDHNKGAVNEFIVTTIGSGNPPASTASSAIAIVTGSPDNSIIPGINFYGGLTGVLIGQLVPAGFYAGVAGVLETWHPMAGSYANTWADAGGASTVGRYRRVASPPNSVEVEGVITHAAITGASNFFTLPAGYAPAGNTPVCEAGTLAGAAFGSALIMCNAGVLQLNGMAVNTTSVFFHGFVSLD